MVPSLHAAQRRGPSWLRLCQQTKPRHPTVAEERRHIDLVHPSHEWAPVSSTAEPARGTPVSIPLSSLEQNPDTYSHKLSPGIKPMCPALPGQLDSDHMKWSRNMWQTYRTPSFSFLLPICCWHPICDGSKEPKSPPHWQESP